MKPRLLMLDNYDSFTYNLVQYFAESGCEVTVHRNDKIDIAAIRLLNPDYIVISPGPCTPDEAGISLKVITQLGTDYPILGVCLGHQCIAQAFGGKIIHADEIMHGKTSEIHHDGSDLYDNIPSPFVVTRYHSLVADPANLPTCLEVTATTKATPTQQTVIMSLKHKELPIWGVQYHPESILTQYGQPILQNFLKQGKNPYNGLN